MKPFSYNKKPGYSRHVLNNPNGYKILALISMLYMSIMLCNAILTNRYIGNDELFVLGGTFTSPFVFLLDNIIAEIYGYEITQFIILIGFASQTMFVLICQAAINAPYPHAFTEESAYAYILGPSLLRINFDGFFAYIIANLANAAILLKWKDLIKGRKFWLRSLGSSMFSEALYSIIAIFMMEIKSIPINNLFKIIIVSFLIKAFYSAVLSYPADIIVNKIKKATGIDVYDFPKELTPEKYFKKEDSEEYEP